MANLTITTCSPVEVIQTVSAPAAEAIPVGKVCKIDPATGLASMAKGSDAAEARGLGIAITPATVPGQMVTILRKGKVDVGNALSALAYDAPVYLSDTDDGLLADSVGTVTLNVARVIPVWNAVSAPDKILMLE